MILVLSVPLFSVFLKLLSIFHSKLLRAFECNLFIKWKIFFRLILRAIQSRDFRDIFHITKRERERRLKGVEWGSSLLGKYASLEFCILLLALIYYLTRPPSSHNFQQLFTLKNLLTTFYVNKNIDYNCIKYN